MVACDFVMVVSLSGNILYGSKTDHVDGKSGSSSVLGAHGFCLGLVQHLPALVCAT